MWRTGLGLVCIGAGFAAMSPWYIQDNVSALWTFGPAGLFFAVGAALIGWDVYQSKGKGDRGDPLIVVLRQPFQVPPEYDLSWLQVNPLTLWQVAWLWVGREPIARIPPGTAAYPIYRMLKADYQKGLLPAQQVAFRQ